MTSFQEVLNTLRGRVGRVVSRRLHDSEILGLSLAASTRQPYDMICILYGGRVSKEVSEAMRLSGQEITSALGITAEEYGTLFGVEAAHAKTALEWPCQPAEQLEGDEPSHRDIVDKLSRAMRTTLVSNRTAFGWKNAALRCAAVLSTHFVSYDSALRALIGELARSDARRVDEYQSDIMELEQSSDGHLLPTCKAIVALTSILT